jgi:hypothetical protein
MGPCTTQLFYCPIQERRVHSHPHDICRLGLASDHVHWPASHAPSLWHDWIVLPPLESGVVALFASHSNINVFFFIPKGIIWLLLAFVSEAPLAVSPATLLFPCLLTSALHCRW